MMNVIKQKLIDAHTVLVLAERKTIDEVPDTPLTLANGVNSTIRKEVEIKVAERTVEILGGED